MFFWLFMVIMVLLVPLTMLYFGRRFLETPPEKINSWFGYRTAMSMKNKDTWAFSHQYCGKLWKTWGLVLLLVSIAAMLPFLGKDVGTVGGAGTIVVLAQCVVLVASIFPVERALKQRFDRNGNPR